MDDWRRDRQPTSGGSASIDMQFSIYPADEPNAQPLLEVKALTLTAAKVPLS